MSPKLIRITSHLMRGATRGLAMSRHVLLCVVMLLSSCSYFGGSNEVTKTSPLFFPPPPAQPRIQYLGSISSPRDLPTERSKIADFVLGEKPLVYPLAKPNNAVLWGSRLLICDTVLNSVLVYDLETGEARPLAGDRGNGKISQPNNLSIDHDRQRLYVADKIRGAVLVYDQEENFIDAWGRPSECLPVDVEASGPYLYVCDIKDHQLELWNRDTGEFIRAIGKRGVEPGQFNYPTFLAIDDKGTVYVTDTFNARIQKFSAEGEWISGFGSRGTKLGQFSWPKGIDVDQAGHVFVVDSRFANVQIFDSNNKLLLFFGGPGPSNGNLDLPAGISVCSWPKLDWVNSRLAEGFSPESLVIVVSQKGAGYINLFAVSGDAEKL